MGLGPPARLGRGAEKSRLARRGGARDQNRLSTRRPSVAIELRIPVLFCRTVSTIAIVRLPSAGVKSDSEATFDQSEARLVVR